MAIDIDKFKNTLSELLQDTEEDRVLDSLESVLIRATIRAEGVSIDDSDGRDINTLGGWLTWLRTCSQVG